MKEKGIQKYTLHLWADTKAFSLSFFFSSLSLLNICLASAYCHCPSPSIYSLYTKQLFGRLVNSFVNICGYFYSILKMDSMDHSIFTSLLWEKPCSPQKLCKFYIPCPPFMNNNSNIHIQCWREILHTVIKILQFITLFVVWSFQTVFTIQHRN